MVRFVRRRVRVRVRDSADTKNERTTAMGAQGPWWSVRDAPS